MRRAGQFSLEGLFAAFFLLMLGGTLWSGYRIFLSQQPEQPPATDVLGTYQNLFFQLRDDFRFAVRTEAGDQELRLVDAEEKVTTYAIASATLVRTDASGARRGLMAGLKTGGFSSGEASPRLVSVWLVPLDQQSMPFFTSFAPRGGPR